MKTSFYSALTVLLLSLSCIPRPFAHETKGPKMVLAERVFDFGEVFENMRVSHIFKVFNKGNQPLKIRGVKPD